MILPGYIENARAIGYRRRWLAGNVAIQIATTLFEALGVASIVPIAEYMRAEGTATNLAESSRGWKALYAMADYLHIPMGFGVLLSLAFLAILVRQAFVFTRVIYSARIQFGLIRDLRGRGLDLFFKAREDVRGGERIGEAVNDLTTELNSVAACMTQATNVFAYLIMFTGYFAIVFVLSPSLSLAAIGITLVIGLTLVYVTRRLRNVGREVTRANQSVTAHLMERLSSARLIRLSGMEGPELSAFHGFLDRQRDLMLGLQKVIGVFHAGMEPLVVLLAFGLLYYAVETHVLPFETLVLFLFILMRLMPVAKELMMSRQAYISTLASIDTVTRRFGALEAGREEDHGTRTFDRLGRGIAFDGVTFAYRNGGEHAPAALVDIDLDLPAGRMTALVGPSGAGKSTLVDLLPRLRTAQKGRVLLDGIPLDEFTLKSLRQGIAYVPQQAQLFNVTAAEHIRFGKQGASDEEVREAARLAQALGFIERLPDGFGTLVGDGGNRLSGGQRQRLDLARALVRRAPILILDEPTSALDAESGRLFHEALLHIRAETDTTIVIIGHHLGSIRIADQIVVMADGRIAAIGTHDELMAGDPWYARAYAAQTEAHAEGGQASVSPSSSIDKVTGTRQ